MKSLNYYFFPQASSTSTITFIHLISFLLTVYMRHQSDFVCMNSVLIIVSFPIPRIISIRPHIVHIFKQCECTLSPIGWPFLNDQ